MGSPKGLDEYRKMAGIVILPAIFMLWPFMCCAGLGLLVAISSIFVIDLILFALTFPVLLPILCGTVIVLVSLVLAVKYVPPLAFIKDAIGDVKESLDNKLQEYAVEKAVES